MRSSLSNDVTNNMVSADISLPDTSDPAYFLFLVRDPVWPHFIDEISR